MAELQKHELLTRFIRRLRDKIVEINNLKRDAKRIRFKKDRFIIDPWSRARGWEIYIDIIKEEGSKYEKGEGNVVLQPTEQERELGEVFDARLLPVIISDILEEASQLLMKLPYIGLKKVSPEDAQKVEEQILDEKNMELIELAIMKLVDLQYIATMLMTSCSDLEEYNGKCPSNLVRFGPGDRLAHLLQDFDSTFSIIGKRINWSYGHRLVKIQ